MPDVTPTVARKVAADRYTSTAFTAQEAKGLWGRVWQAACREEEVAEPGDFVEYTIGERPLVVTRAGDGRLHAFPNVCRHRGTQLLEGHGRVPEIRCPFHAWRWALDGQCLSIVD